MATNLRNLLSKKDAVSKHAYEDTGLPRFPLEGYETINIPVTGLFDMSHNQHCEPDSHHFTMYPDWEVPSGVTDVIFEIWGGGGAGAGSCCCHLSIPGGAGAYAYKRLLNSEVVPGCKYTICIAQASERASACRGRRGCKSYILGHNLNNFCAEGGHGGSTYCNGCSSANTNLLTPRFGCTDGCIMGCCAVYYGADYGAYGLPSSYKPTSSGGEARCCNHIRFAYPGGLINSRGGWSEVGQSCYQRNCALSETKRAMGIVGFGGSYCNAYIPGFPGGSAYNCDDSVYCGVMGMPGYARISFK